jgi:hypothetical protein
MNTYCVILCRRPLVNPLSPRTKRCYLGADTADRAILIASDDNPEWRAIGVEPRDLSAPLVQSDYSHPTPDNWHAA